MDLAFAVAAVSPMAEAGDFKKGKAIRRAASGIGDSDTGVSWAGDMDASDGAPDRSTTGCADKPLRAGEFQLFVKTGVKALTEAGRDFEDAFVCDEDDDVAGGVEDGGTYLTGFKMAVNVGA